MNIKTTKEYFINKANSIHGVGTYDYSNVDYKKASIKVEIKHNKCGSVYLQTPNDHTSGGHGCNFCSTKRTADKQRSNKGEFLKKVFLNYPNNINLYRYNDVEYHTNHTPVKILCLKCNNILIEFDGEQHFKPISFKPGGETKKVKLKNLKELKYRDSFKTKWAIKNNIPLIRISYLEENILEEKILKLIRFLNSNII